MFFFLFFWGGDGYITLGLNSPQDPLKGPEKVFGGSILLEAQQLIPKRTRMFCLALKKIFMVYFFKGQTKHSGSFWNQLLSFQSYGPPEHFFWALK